MFGHIWKCIGAFLVILECVAVAKYIFRLPSLKNRKWDNVLLGIAIPVIVVLEQIFENEVAVWVFLMVGFYFSICSKKHRIRGFCLIFPVIGLVYGIETLCGILLLLLPKRLAFEKRAMLIDIFIMCFYFAFLIFGKNWRRRFEEEKEFREYSIKEKVCLNAISILLLCYAMTMYGIINEHILADITTLIVLTSLIMFILTFSIIALILQGNKKSYYHAMAVMNEYYLEAEVAHFEAYQKKQVETRRIRHDMKSHLQSLEYLLNEKDYEGAKEYLHEIGIEVKELTTDINTGNSIVDAIINEKQQTAWMYYITIQTEGRFVEAFHIKPVDLCTIFANALDNAIEATKEITDMGKRVIEIQIKSQGQFLCVVFENPINHTRESKENYIGSTSKKDTINHGFGLLNIQNAIKKYHGTMEMKIEQKNAMEYFILQIVMILNS